MYDYSNVSLFGFIGALICVGLLQLQFYFSLFTPFFRGNTKTIDGFTLWKKGDLTYTEIISGPKANEFLADVSYGYEIFTIKGNKVKVKPRKKTHQIENNIVEFDSLYYTLSNNYLFIMDEKLQYIETKDFDIHIDHIFADSRGLCAIASEYHSSKKYFYRLENETNMQKLDMNPNASIHILSDGFIADSTIYNLDGEKIDTLEYLKENPDFCQMISTKSKFLINIKYSSDGKEFSKTEWTIAIKTLSDSSSENIYFNKIPTQQDLRSVRLVLSPNEKYYVYTTTPYSDSSEVWLGEIYKENGMYKSKDQKIGSFDHIDDIEFSKNGEILALKILNKGKMWFAFKNLSLEILEMD